MADYFVYMRTLTSGQDIVGFDPMKGSVSIEYKNSTDGRRHRVWFEDPRTVHQLHRTVLTQNCSRSTLESTVLPFGVETKSME
jgi:hypothetical protein